MATNEGDHHNLPERYSSLEQSSTLTRLS